MPLSHMTHRPKILSTTMKLEASEKAFEIKVAFIGPKNAGKSTLINALLKDKFAPVGIGGATTSVNSFRIFTKANPLPNIKAEAKNDDSRSTFSVHPSTNLANDAESVWTAIPENLCTAAESLKMISDHKLAHPTSDDIKELTFDVELAEGLCDMRADTNLVLVDIPGIKSNVANCKYMRFLRNKWDTFDYVVFVLDVFQPLDDQVFLLKIVKQKLAAQTTEVPIIVVCNKVDDAVNQEMVLILSELQSLVQGKYSKYCKYICGEYYFIYS
jgi:GTPase SAR1 family protein